MPAAPTLPLPLPLLRRVPPGAWTALTWCASTVYACVVLVTTPGEGTVVPDHGLMRPPGNWAYLAVATAFALAGSAVLRRFPLPAVGLLLLGSLCGAMALNSMEINFLQFLAVDVALCVIAAGSSRRSSLTALAMAIALVTGYAVVRLLLGYGIGTSTDIAVCLTAVVAWFIGHSGHEAREHAEQVRAQAAAAAVNGERLRIARELHDMVAHSIGIIALQAGAARRVIDTQPDRARTALSEVETAGRETLSGLRRMLVALRAADSDEPGEGAPRHPAPGLADVDRLAAATTAAGVRVDVRWQGERRALPPEIDLSAFRIIQESVTNVVRHAGTASCQVSIACQDEELSIEVVDTGRGEGATGGGGFGLAGMRERVTLLHGDFSAGRRPGGGFRVAARLPVPEAVR